MTQHLPANASTADLIKAINGLAVGESFTIADVEAHLPNWTVEKAKEGGFNLNNDGEAPMRAATVEEALDWLRGETWKEPTPMKAKVDIVEYVHLEDVPGSEERGEPCVGIQAKATVRIFQESHPDGTSFIIPITSGGLWGVEVASDAAYIAEVEQEQRVELASTLAALGLTI